jgi:branched-subunit amino acid aminotransferase/4-amino-4-deoxychorismate lyase
VTRQSVCDIISHFGPNELGGYQLAEGDVTVDNLKNGTEVFCCGTGAGENGNSSVVLIG